MNPGEVLRIRDFRRLLVGQALSGAGSAMLMLAVLIEVFAATRSTSMTTLAFLVEMSPKVLVSPFAGLLADRYDRRRLVIAADVARALLLVPLALSPLPVLLSVLLPVLAAQSAVDAVFRPAFGAMLPGRVGAEHLAAANGLMNTTFSSLGLFMPALGAALYSAYGLRFIVICNIATFLLSALATATLAPESRAAVVTVEHPVASIRTELEQGARAIWHQPLLRVVVLAECTLFLAQGMLTPVFVPFVVGVLHGNPHGVGIAATVQSVGGVAAGLVVAAVAHKVRPSRMALFGIQGFAIAVTGMALAPNYAIGLLFMFLIGVPGTFAVVGLDTTVQANAPAEVLGRVIGAKQTMANLGMLVAAGVPVLVAPLLGVRGVFGVGAAILVLTAVVLVRGERVAFRRLAQHAGELEGGRDDARADLARV